MVKKDPSLEQTAAGLSTLSGFDLDKGISVREKSILQGLARRIKELSSRSLEEAKKTLWIHHNDLENTRPVIFCDPENGWNEIITQDQIFCENQLLRVWEMYLRKEIYWAEEMKDDRVVEPYFNVPYCYTDSEWGLKEIKIESETSDGSYVWKAPIADYESDFPGLSFPEITLDYKETDKAVDLAREIFGDILQVRLKSSWWWTLGMTWDFVKLRGLQNLMLDMIDQPDNVHRLMSFLSNGMMKKLDFLENEGLLSSNTAGTYVGSGGFGWTKELPDAGSDKSGAKLADMWGFAESQETVGVSPEMFGEFIFPYQLPLLKRFGLNCYGCCEPLDKRWGIIKKIPRLRRISVSPWADHKAMSEYLGKDYIFSCKPSPTPLAQSHMDEIEIRSQLKNILADAGTNNLELIMKDNHTLGKNPRNAARWVEIAREEIDKL